jgi:Fis family transcriptional regulator, factor for inversion stimulation protein
VVEPPLLQTALERNSGKRASAARALGLRRNTLRKKLIQHGIVDDLAIYGSQQ